MAAQSKIENRQSKIPKPRFGEAVAFWLRLGFISFGGPAGQIAILHTELVEKRKWITEDQFLRALNFCMLLPGPEAQQLTTYIGWRLHGIRGGVVAGLLFILPAAILLWALSWLYAAGGEAPWIEAVLAGLQPAVLAIVFAAVIRLGRKSLKSIPLAILAVAAFGAIFVFKIAFPWVILGAALAGLVINHPPLADFHPPLPPASARSIFPILPAGLILWWLPVGIAAAFLGSGSLLVQQGIFFSQTALVTFGGAYAVLPYVAQQTVEQFGWLQAPQMIDGLALAETTPGPLIMVLQFVGFIAAWQNPEPFSPLIAGTLGAAMTTWTTFAPSFLLVLLGAPFIERLGEIRSLNAALGGITAAVVGVILNLAVWFGAHVIFPAGLDFTALALAIGFFAGIQWGKWGTPLVVGLGAAAGLLRWGLGGI